MLHDQLLTTSKRKRPKREGREPRGLQEPAPLSLSPTSPQLGGGPLGLWPTCKVLAASPRLPARSLQRLQGYAAWSPPPSNVGSRQRGASARPPASRAAGGFSRQALRQAPGAHARRPAAPHSLPARGPHSWFLPGPLSVQQTRRPESTFLPKGHGDGQQMQERMLKVTKHQGNGN